MSEEQITLIDEEEKRRNDDTIPEVIVSSESGQIGNAVGTVEAVRYERPMEYSRDNYVDPKAMRIQKMMLLEIERPPLTHTQAILYIRAVPTPKTSTVNLKLLTTNRKQTILFL